MDFFSFYLKLKPNLTSYFQNLEIIKKKKSTPSRLADKPKEMKSVCSTLMPNYDSLKPIYRPDAMTLKNFRGLICVDNLSRKLFQSVLLYPLHFSLSPILK